MASSTVDRRLGLTGNKAYKAPVDVATTGNIALSGEQTIDGVLTDESRVLVWNQTNPVDNGIWDTSTGTWSRSVDANTNQDLATGTQVYVAGGATYEGSRFVFTTANPIQPGTSSITIELSTDVDTLAQQLKSLFFVSVKDEPYNAVGDGVNDDTAEIQAALTAMGALTDGGAVFFPAGTYRHTGLSVPSNVTLWGVGFSSILKLANSANAASLQSADSTNGTDNVTIRDLCIDGNKANQAVSSAGYASHGINIDGPCLNWKIEGVKVMNTQGHGTHIRGGGPAGAVSCVDGVEISGCYYTETGYYDVGATNGRECVYANQSTNLRITNNLMELSGRQTIALEGSTSNPAVATRYTVISDNILRSAKSGAGIDDEANGGGDHIFANNVIYNMTGAGIRTVGDTGRKIIADNDIFNVGSRGIDAESEAGFAGASLHITNNIVDTTVTEGIKIVGCQKTLIEGNTVTGAGTIGIYARNQVATEYGLRIIGSNVSGSGQEGIVVDRPSVGPHICGNQVTNAGSAAFPSAAISIRGNTGFIESPVIEGNTVYESRGTPYTTYAYSFAHLNKPSIANNGVVGTTATNDVQWAATAATNVILGHNSWSAARVTGAPASYFQAYAGRQAMYGAFTHALSTVTYSSAMTLDPTVANFFRITATTTVAFSLSIATSANEAGNLIGVMIRNASTGTLGTVTFNSPFKVSANWVQPAIGNSRSLMALSDGTNYVELTRSATDVPN